MFRIPFGVRIDKSYPFRLDLYRSREFGSPQGLRPLVVAHGFSAQLYGMQWLMHMLAELLREQYAVYQYAFETELSFFRANSTTLEAASRELRRELIRVAKRDQLDLKGAAFIGHSTGGLVARRAFIDEQDLWNSARFVFFATPHYGSRWADVKNVVFPNDRQTDELARGSDFIWRLSTDWAQLPETAVDGCLSIVGTCFELPKLGAWSKWGRSDGVVRTPAAFLTSRGPGKYLVLPVRLGHSTLKDAPTKWKRMGSLQNRVHTEVPDPSTDLPIIATKAFLEPASTPTYSQFWGRCLELFENFESQYHHAQVYKLQGKEQYSDGKWRYKGMKEVAEGQYEDTDESTDAAMKAGLAAFEGDFKHAIAKHRWPSEPECLPALQRYANELTRYWNSTKGGALIIRLDSIDLPPLPRVVRFAKKVPGGEEDVRLPKCSFLRRGARWVTLCIPDIDRGEYRIKWEHGRMSFFADCPVTSHCTTTVEIDGHVGRSSKGRVSILSGDNASHVNAFQDGLAQLSDQLASRTWNVSGDWVLAGEDED